MDKVPKAPRQTNDTLEAIEKRQVSCYKSSSEKINNVIKANNKHTITTNVDVGQADPHHSFRPGCRKAIRIDININISRGSAIQADYAYAALNVYQNANSALGDVVRSAVSNLNGHHSQRCIESKHWEEIDDRVGAPTDHSHDLSAHNLAPYIDP